MQVPFVSGSARFDAMVIMPCSMGTVGRIAHGYSDSVITRAADVFLKEKTEAHRGPARDAVEPHPGAQHRGATGSGRGSHSAIPSFYHRPKRALDMVDTVLARVLDHFGPYPSDAKRWMQP